MARRRRLKVFISYARRDQAKAHELYKRLTDDGLEVWIDKASLLPGQDWELEIRKFIRQADVFIVCLSKKFNKAGFRQKEVRLALDVASEKTEGEIFIIPVRLEKCDNLESLTKWSWFDYFDTEDKPAEHGYQDLINSLLLRARKAGASLRVKGGKTSNLSSLRQDINKNIPCDVLKTWLIRQGMIINPFKYADINNHPFYPEGVVRPDQWEFLFEPVPLIAHCPTIEDAQALAYLLKKESFPLKKNNWEVAVNRQIFPILVWPQQTISTNLLLILAHSAAQAWLDFLLLYPQIFFEMPLDEQRTLIELLCWSLGSKNDLIKIIQLASNKETDGKINLVRTIYNLNIRSLLSHEPQDDLLFSWVKIRPNGIGQTNLIFYGDNLARNAPKQWHGQFGSLYSNLIINKIFPKFITTVPLSNFPSIQEIKLSWSEEWLFRSLEGQFDAAMHPQEKSIGKSIRFHELFGLGSTETETTHKLISKSRNSLARMLVLGNLLLQYHFENRGISEKHLYIKDLKTILKLA
jgi:hypothetical protein